MPALPVAASPPGERILSQSLSYGTDFLFDPASKGLQASQLARFGKYKNTL
jgi:hypothetical protein